MVWQKFYGSVFGRAKTPATRLGTKKSGMTTTCATKGGAVKVDMVWNEIKQKTSIIVWVTGWGGESFTIKHKVLFTGYLEDLPREGCEE